MSPASPGASPAAPVGNTSQALIQPAHSPDPRLATGHDCVLELRFDAEAVSRFLDWLGKRRLHVCTAENGSYQSYGKSPIDLIAEWMGLDPATVGWDVVTRTVIVGHNRAV